MNNDSKETTFEPKPGVIETTVYKTSNGDYYFDILVLKGKVSHKSKPYKSRLACLLGSVAQSVNVYITQV